MDILFHSEDYVFSYRVAGICVKDGNVLLQKPSNDTGFAFPGGHVVFGEINEQTLIREFREEIGADISVGDLKWVAEIFFPWGNKRCHQICLYYIVEIRSDHIPSRGMFIAKEEMEGQKFQLEYHWIPIEKIKEIDVYPTNTVELLGRMEEGVQHFIYRE